MGVKQYFEFKGVKYGIGTIAKVPRNLDLINLPREKIMMESEFVGGDRFIFKDIKGFINLYEGSGHLSGKYEQYIEIIEPVYYQEPEPLNPQNIFLRTQSGSWDAHNKVCTGLIWYILVMLVGIIFKERLLIWIVATIVFFIWKSKL